ncbi:Dihydrofolate reductase [Seinonella peptonophila]|uniref:Dihydrofolate reductase n=1 Tax=Seinonella peptonophila TaxID=112248 RepID=A0A1M4YQ56_9BACL|nr:dihydrofolate reductase family protein [Seinonella peptonophila]SHF07813.1 Dihydrofolate reductase [Seinonella peptonophila]
MGKLIANLSSTLDGIFTGPKGDENNMVSWAMPGIMDSNNDNLAMFQNADAILMGRVNYEGLASYWPYQKDDDWKDWADAMNQTQKYVASNKLTEVKWGDYSDTITLLNSDVMENVAKLKSEIKNEMIVSASAKLVQSLLKAGLVDELQILIHPIILGSGKRYFENISTQHNMKLVSTKVYKTSGSIKLRYEMVN